MSPWTCVGEPGFRKPQDLTAAPQIDYFYTFPVVPCSRFPPS